MADDPFPALAVGLNEDAKATRASKRTKPAPQPAAEPEKQKDEPAPGEPQHLNAIERMGAAAEEFLLNAGSLVNDTRDFLLEQIKMRPKPWSATSESEQRDVAAACEQSAEVLVRKIVEGIAAGDKQPIRVMLESFTEKDGIKLTMKVKSFNEEEAFDALMQLHKGRGKHMLLTLASVDDYKADRPAETQADQPDLGFEAGSDEHPADDSDLAGDEEEETSTARPEPMFRDEDEDPDA